MIGNIKGRLKGKNKVKVGEIHNEEDAIKEIAKLEKPCSRRLGICSLKKRLYCGIGYGGLRKNYYLGVIKFLDLFMF